MTTETNQIDTTLTTLALATSLTTETGEIDTVLTTLATSAALTAETDDIDDALAALAASLTAETDEIDAALAALAASLTTETDEIDAALAELAASEAQKLRLLIEDRLESCRPLASQLLDKDDLLALTVEVVEDLVARAITADLDGEKAQRHLDRAKDRIDAGDVRKGFRSLCDAYNAIVNGG